MGGYNIKYGAMDTLYTMTSSQINEWYTQLGNWASSYNEMVELESFQGISAANAKSYLQEVHGLLICALQQAMSTYQSCLLLYKDGYYGIEDNIYASLPQEVIKNITTRMGTESTTLTSISDSVNGSLESISDIISIPNPTMSVLMNTIVGVKEELTTFDSDIESYETEQSGVVNGDLKSLLDSLQRSVSDCLANGANIVSYTPGSIAGNTNMLELYDNVLKNAEYINNNKEEIEQAAAGLEAVYAQMRADYEAACEARKDQGTANMIMGGAAIVLGAVVIFATAGMATPVVVTAGVTAGSTIAFGASNFAEGAQDFYYGCVGNLDSAAINPIRDTIFASNPDLYYVWGEMNMMVAGMCIPAGQVINGFAGQGGKVLLQETLKVIVKDQVKDYAFDWASGEITNFATENLHLNQTQSTLLNLGLNFGMDKGSDFIGQKGHFSNTMAEGMSYDDALRYNQHWSDLENGTYNHHPGMSDADIASWDFANGRLDEHLAIQQVDPNAVMDLRLKELEIQNNLLNGTTEVPGGKIELSADDIAYEKHWSDLENGTYNHHPGMNASDIALWDFANGRVNEHLAIDKVDTNALMDLRLKELEAQNKFLNAPAKSEGGEYSVLGEMSEADGIKYNNWMKVREGELHTDYIAAGHALTEKLSADGYNVIKEEDAIIANADWYDMGFDKPPIADGTKAYTVQAGDHSYSRVYLEGYNKPMSTFLIRSDDIAGLNAEEIAQKLALPKVPNKVVYVELPPETPLEVSVVGPQPDWGTIGGDIQFAIKDVDLNPNWFTNIHDLQ